MRKKMKKARSEKREPKLNQETKNSVAAVLLIGLAIVMLLASFKKAGPAGDVFYASSALILGVGYYLIPGISLIVALFFLISSQKKFLSMAFIGSLFFVISGLGLIDILSPGKGGFVGNLVGALELILGNTAAIVITATFLAASFLIALNLPLKLRFKSKDKEEKTGEENNEEELVKIEIPDEPGKPVGGEMETRRLEEAKKPVAEESDIPKFQMSPASFKKRFKNYAPLPLSLLKSSIEKPTAGDLRANANIIKRTLDSFGIPVEMGEINIGPKVTRYTLKPAEGVKLSRLTALNPDMALALAAHPIRIEAPIPGKSLVGIEVPNKSAAIVRLGSLMAYQDFQTGGPLAFVLGRDVTGEPIFADIEKMPHLLVAGSTGSGKSVAIHSLLISLLYKNSPETLKMILIDPKRVELTAYNGIPHLVSPVITDGKKTVGVFRWAIQEMERRYQVLQEAGARDIKSFNKSADAPMPYLAIVIDELADLMAAFGREIESSIVRLAQMARATGIHLVLSTQRPSVEVLTGLIKANITTRIALQVPSQVDSRTILDSAGAEKLLGGGDMLFISSEFSKPKRIQGAYISEEEIHKVVDFIKSHSETAEPAEGFDQEIAAPDFSNLGANDEDDDLFPEAVQAVKEAGKASASFLQRRLKVGYARAARLLDIMEAKGIIGPGDGAKPREVYLEEEQNGNQNP